MRAGDRDETINTEVSDDQQQSTAALRSHRNRRAEAVARAAAFQCTVERVLSTSFVSPSLLPASSIIGTSSLPSLPPPSCHSP